MWFTDWLLSISTAKLSTLHHEMPQYEYLIEIIICRLGHGISNEKATWLWIKIKWTIPITIGIKYADVINRNRQCACYKGSQTHPSIV